MSRTAVNFIGHRIKKNVLKFTNKYSMKVELEHGFLVLNKIVI